MSLLLISGSVRAGSTNTAALRAAGGELYEGILDLPHFHPDVDAEGAEVPAPVRDLRERIAAADAVLICTPEYAGALPAVLKNLLEWTIGAASLYGKRVGWINVSPRADDAHASLAKVLGYAGAEVVVAERIVVPRDQVVDGEVADPAARAAVAAVVAALS